VSFVLPALSAGTLGGQSPSRLEPTGQSKVKEEDIDLQKLLKARFVEAQAALAAFRGQQTEPRKWRFANCQRR
jgi:hypothetical protein